MKHDIYIGTSGWSYKHWRADFYPEKTKAADYLPYYAQYFKAVEINSSFYHLPRETTVERWTAITDKSFCFCPKIYRLVTHLKKLHDPEHTLPPFFDLFYPVRKRLGPVLIQLPPSLSFNEEVVTAFYQALHQFKGYRFALEARHESWFDTRSMALMKRHKITMVIAESGGRWPCMEYIGESDVYVRLHGPAGDDSSYDDKFLRKLAGKINRWKNDGHVIWVFFNNDGHAHAVRNAQRLISFLED